MRRLLLFALFALSTVASAQTHPFSVHDMLAMDRISDAQVSPDGKSVAFVVRVTNLAANRGMTDLWVVGTDGNGLRRMTSHTGSDSSPRWSPDGKTIYFLSTRSGSSQIWQLALGGGEATQVTSAASDIGSFRLSPDGSRIAFSAEVFPGKSMEESAAEVEARTKRQATGRVYDELLFRHWDAWFDGRRNHLSVMPAKGGAAVDIMKDMKADAPSKPFGGAEEYTFTPDGKSVVFTARDAGREEAWSTNFDLFLVNADGTGRLNLTAANKAWDTAPSFSPDGRTLAYTAMERAGFEADRFRIILRSWPDGATRVLTQQWDRSAGELKWSSDGKTIYTTTDNLGQHSLFAIDAASGNVRTVVKEGYVTSPGVVAGAKGIRSREQRIGRIGPTGR